MDGDCRLRRLPTHCVDKGLRRLKVQGGFTLLASGLEGSEAAEAEV